MRPRSRYHDCGGVGAVAHAVDRTCAENVTGASPAARRGTSACPSSTASIPQPSTSSGMPAERRDGVDEQQRVGVAAARASGAISFSTPVDVSACTTATRRACGWRALGVEQPLRVERAPPRRVDAHDLGAAAPRDLAHALAEDTVDADDHGVAGLEQVDEARLHAGRAGTADRQRQRVLRAEDGAEAVAASRRGARGSPGRGDRAAAARTRPSTSGYGFDGPGPSSRRSLSGMVGTLAVLVRPSPRGVRVRQAAAVPVPRRGADQMRRTGARRAGVGTGLRVHARGEQRAASRGDADTATSGIGSVDAVAAAGAPPAPRSWPRAPRARRRGCGRWRAARRSMHDQRPPTPRPRRPRLGGRSSTRRRRRGCRRRQPLGALTKPAAPRRI